MMMGFRVETNAMAATAGFGISLAFALCFCWISMFVGMKVRTSGAVQGVVFLIVLPLSFCDYLRSALWLVRHPAASGSFSAHH